MKNLDLIFWRGRSQDAKLLALRDDNQRLQRQHEDLEAKLGRLMAHLGLVEIDGPRIVKVDRS